MYVHLKKEVKIKKELCECKLWNLAFSFFDFFHCVISSFTLFGFYIYKVIIYIIYIYTVFETIRGTTIQNLELNL